ncbi:MAG: LysR family transcriptional regulator [Herminiimonas sp.]|nr:LysR family transcriptional regulator [Herminiimonas sp.]
MKNSESAPSINLHLHSNEQRQNASIFRGTRPLHITLKQWKMFHAVVESGTFSEAAELLHISQSAISYTIAKLQDQLGIPVLKIEGRKAQLTPEGCELLERSRHLIREAIELEMYAENLRHGWGLDVRLAVDQNFPTSLLMAALRKVSELECNMKVSLIEMDTSEAGKSLSEHKVDLAITHLIPSGFNGSPLIEVEYVAVAHPDHPLFKLGRQVVSSDLAPHVHIVVAASKEDCYKDEGTPLVGRRQRWNVNNVDTAVSALCEGMGYAWLPRHRVESWLAKGVLAVLPLHPADQYRAHLYLISGPSMTARSGVKAFADLLKDLATANQANLSGSAGRLSA